MPDQDGAVCGDTLSAEAAWSGIGELYNEPGVRSAVHRLQDDLGLSVSAMLTLVWYTARRPRALACQALAQAVPRLQAVESSVLQPLREARRGAGSLAADGGVIPPAIRGQLLDVELACERAQLEELLHVLAVGESDPVAGNDPLAATSTTLARYVARVQVTPSPEHVQALSHLLAAGLGDYDGLHVLRIWQRAWVQARNAV